ncbi:MAG: hypothetical protein AB8B85_17550 [Paracoccaceae bacterium]
MDALLSRLDMPKGKRVPYREEIHHPALFEPEIATGTVWALADGALMRDQVTPHREIAEIRDNVLRLRSAPEGEPVIYPIPANVSQALGPIRMLLTGKQMDQDLVVMENDEHGWRLFFGADTATRAQVFGCGARPRGVKTEDVSGVRRTTWFLDPP